MSSEDRLHQMEMKLDRLEKKEEERWQSYKRLLNGFKRVLGGDIEEGS